MATIHTESPQSKGPIGVFDSGVGGLSVLQALRAELPHEQFIYIADNGHAPYGERSADFVVQRTHAITKHLRDHYMIKALVVACNTATAAAIQDIRLHHPQLVCIGVEPALKPAVQASKTHQIGVIATRGTVESTKFSNLQKSLEEKAQFVVQACDGLAHAIELSALDAGHVERVRHLCTQYLENMGEFGTKNSQMDVLILGCTHYVFAKDILQILTGPDVVLIDTGFAVARHTHQILKSKHLLRNAAFQDSSFLKSLPGNIQEPMVRFLTTGDLNILQAATERWLHLPQSTCGVVSVP